MTVQRLGQRAGLLGGRNADTFWLGSPWFADDFRARGFLRLEGALTVEAETRPAFGIACVQFEPVIGEVDANVDAMEARIRRAHAEGAELIVLPELADTG